MANIGIDEPTKSNLTFFLYSVWAELKQSRGYQIVSGLYLLLNLATASLWFVTTRSPAQLLSSWSAAAKISLVLTAVCVGLIILFYGFVAGAQRVHQKAVRDIKNRHSSELSALQEELRDVKDPQVSIDYLAHQPSFFALKSVGRKNYRGLRVRVTNDGGTGLYELRAQLKLINQHTSYENEDLTLKDEGLPIIRQILYRHQQDVLPKPRTSFSLMPGESEFVNVAMQENENGKWASVTLCLSRIGVDNYSNIVYPKEPIHFSVVVLGAMLRRSKHFVLFLDQNGILEMEEA
ncbi:MAG: hypothetical protein ACXW3C_04020 [Pyrinomonadaceae bacterium]